MTPTPQQRPLPPAVLLPSRLGYRHSSESLITGRREKRCALQSPLRPLGPNPPLTPAQTPGLPLCVAWTLLPLQLWWDPKGRRRRGPTQEDAGRESQKDEALGKRIM